MKILFDHQIFSIQRYGGISTYFYNLYKNLSGENDIGTDISIIFSDNNDISSDRSFGASRLFRPKVRGKYRIQNYINRKRSVKLLKKNDFDIFHPTYFDPYFLPYLKGKPFVLTIFDMAFERGYTKDLHKKLISDKKRLAEAAAEIIAISETTRKDIVDILGIERSKVHVVHLAGDHILSENELKHPVINKKYMLFVGSRGSYKNFHFFLSSAARVLKDDKELHLVCAGGGKFTEEEIRFFRKLGVKSKVLFYDADNTSLHNLYKNAEFFVFPSLYEGFGIPVIEAFSSGCPVLLSDIKVFREIAGDAALFFDPEDEISINSVLTNVVDNIILKKSLRDRGIKRGRFFSWEKTANTTLNVYKKLN